jgi:hypothetical protein
MMEKGITSLGCNVVWSSTARWDVVGESFSFLHALTTA